MLGIKLTNWMTHAETHFVMHDELGFIIGGNGVGKTAIRDAIEFAYLGTGKLRGIDTKKDLAALSIRDGARECEVEIFCTSWRIRRTMNSGGGQKLYRQEKGFEEEPITLSDAQEKLLGGLAGDALRITLEPTEWLRVSAERRAEILIDATRSTTGGVDDFEKAMLHFLEPDSPAEKKAIRMVAEKSVEDGIREGESLAIEKRKEAKRKRDELGSTEPHPYFEGIDLSAHPIEAHEEKLLKLRVDREQLIVHDTKLLTEASTRAQDAFDELKTMLARRFPDPDETAESDLAAARSAHADAVTAAAEAQAALEAAQDAFDAADGFDETAVPQIEHPGQCPHLPTMKCNVKLATFQKALEASAPAAPTAGELQELQDAIDTARKDLQIRQDTVEKWAQDRDSAAARVEAERERGAAVKAHSEAVDAQEAKVSELDAKRDRLRTEMDEQPSDAPTPEALEERIELGERVVSAKRAYDAAIAEQKSDAEKKASLEREIACWDAIAREMKPGGPIERKAAGEAETPFMNALADFEVLTGPIAIEPDMSLRVGPEKRHPAQLSTSERMALGIAIQHALATTLQFPILCCDALDLFDQEGRKAWLAAASRVLESNYPHGGIMALATSTTGTVGEPPPGCVNFHLTMTTGGVHVNEIRRDQP